MSNWESVKSQLDPNVYGKGGKLGYKTRQILGSALDNFNTDLEDLDEKRSAVYAAIAQVENDEERSKLEKSLTLSIASTYEKMKNSVLHERTLVTPAPTQISSAFDSFMPEESMPETEGFDQHSLANALKLVERLQRSAQY